MAAGGADTLVLVVDAGGSVEGLLEGGGPDEGRRPVEAVGFHDGAGDVDPPLSGHLLLEQPHREDGGQQLRTRRLTGVGIQGRRRGHGEIGRDVVPGRGDRRTWQVESPLRCAHTQEPPVSLARGEGHPPAPLSYAGVRQGIRHPRAGASGHGRHVQDRARPASLALVCADWLERLPTEALTNSLRASTRVLRPKSNTGLESCLVVASRSPTQPTDRATQVLA